MLARDLLCGDQLNWFGNSDLHSLRLGKSYIRNLDAFEFGNT
jgi:hypothetical protein